MWEWHVQLLIGMSATSIVPPVVRCSAPLPRGTNECVSAHCRMSLNALPFSRDFSYLVFQELAFRLVRCRITRILARILWSLWASSVRMGSGFSWVGNEAGLLDIIPVLRTFAYLTCSGFVEQGETFEEAARREAWEETGLEVGDVYYQWCVVCTDIFSSQPWPFPAQLMVGLLAYATSPDTDLQLDLDAELEEAFFATKAEIQQILRYVRREGKPLYRHGHEIVYVWMTDTSVPGRRAMAHVLLAGWAQPSGGGRPHL